MTVWAAIVGVTAAAAPGVGRKVAAGSVLAVAAIAIQFAQHPQRRVRQIAVLVTTVGGLAGTLLSPSGLSEIATFFAASRIPGAFSTRQVRVLTPIDAVAVGVVVGVVSHSWIGAVAGLGIPLLVQRATEHEELVRSHDRAQALLAEVEARREAETQAVALRERGRIARELHDVLAHTLAGLSVQLQAVRAVAAREQVSATVMEPLDTAAELARSGLAEARAAVGVLRDPIGLGIDDVPALVARHPGPPTLHLYGEGTVSPAAGHAVYRAIQESLTNAARYAPGSSVSVTLDWQPGALHAMVADSGLPVGRSAVADQGTGLGLAGMGERLLEVGGTVVAGPVVAGPVVAGPGAGRGWQVAIVVPAQPA